MPATITPSPWIFAALLLGAIHGSSFAADPGIVGRWTSDDRSQGGIGQTLVFDASDGFVSTVGALIDFRYEVNGSVLRIFDAPVGGGIRERTAVWVFRADRLLVRWDDDGALVELARGGDAEETQPLGLWRFQHSTGVPASWQFTRAGMAQLSVPLQTTFGRYRLDGHTLTMSSVHGVEATHSANVLSDKLYLTRQGKSSSFTRVRP